MSQNTITNFFSPLPLGNGGNTRMKRKASTDESNTKKGDATFSPEAKKRAADSQLVAKIRLRSNQFQGALQPSIGPSWFALLEEEFVKPYFLKLNDFLLQERNSKTIFPDPKNVWSWTSYFDVSDTKVVLLGQDPYHGPHQAHGLCFSVERGVRIPPSLGNMFKELKEDENVDFTHPGHGYLEGWAKQGVLMLNACLTVQKGTPNSHKQRGWEELTSRVIKLVSDHCSPGVVFLLWGAYAQKKAAAVDNKKHHLLEAVHPSPLSASRGFFGCRHFSKCNELLVDSGRNPIDWSDL